MFQRFLSGSFWMLAANVAWRIPTAISTIMVGRILGPQAFGEYSLALNTTYVTANFAGLHLQTTATKYIAEYRNSDPERTARFLGLTQVLTLLSGYLASIGLFFSAPWLAGSVLGHPQLTTALELGSVLLFFTIRGNVQDYSVAGFENFRGIALVNILRGLGTPILCIPLALVYGSEGAIAGLAIVAALAFLWQFILQRDTRRRAGITVMLRFGEIRKEFPILWAFALPGMLTDILTLLPLWASRIMLAEYRSYAELGLYEAAYQWRTLILFLPAILSRAALPILSESYGKDSRGDFCSAIGLQFQAVCLVTAPVVILAIGFSETLTAFYGQQYQDAGRVLPILLAAAFLNGLNQAVRMSFESAGRRWLNLAMHALWALSFLVLGGQLVPSSGVFGLASSALGAECLLLVVQAAYVNQTLAPGVLLAHLPLLLYMLLLIGVGLLVQGSWAEIVAIALLVAALLPSLRRIIK